MRGRQAAHPETAHYVTIKEKFTCYLQLVATSSPSVEIATELLD